MKLYHKNLDHKIYILLLLPDRQILLHICKYINIHINLLLYSGVLVKVLGIHVTAGTGTCV